MLLLRLPTPLAFVLAPLQELDWCMKELAALQKERNDWRCSSWLEGAVGRSTILAAPDEQIWPGEYAAWSIWSLKVTLDAQHNSGCPG